MRTNKKTFLSCALAAAIGLFAAPEAMATGSCSSFNPTFTILAGPCPVDSANPLACLGSGSKTGIKYKITGSPDHVATVVTANNSVLVPSGFQAYSACSGDPLTGLGKYSCHEKAVKVNPNQAAAGEFWVVVQGTKNPILQSMVAKKGSCIKSDAVLGLGLDFPVAAPVTETLTDHNGCSVEFTLDAAGGTVLSAKLTAASVAAGCESPDMADDGTLVANSVANLKVFLNGDDLGFVNFGSGYLNSGTSTCTTKIVGGKLYTYGKPCP